jgi:hypothetical protein
MAYQGVISPVQVTEELNYIHFDVKAALRASQSDIRILIDELGDPTKDLIIDGKKYSGADKFGPAASLALTNKLSQLQDTTTSILGVFSELYKLEKSLGGLTS